MFHNTCPDWARVHIKSDNCEIVSRVQGGFAVVDHGCQVQVGWADTRWECEEAIHHLICQGGILLV